MIVENNTSMCWFDENHPNTLHTLFAFSGVFESIEYMQNYMQHQQALLSANNDTNINISVCKWLIR
jgi:hypothetical protein